MKDEVVALGANGSKIGTITRNGLGKWHLGGKRLG